MDIDAASLDCMLMSMGSIDLGMLDDLDLPDLSVLKAEELPDKINSEMTARYGSHWAGGNPALQCSSMSQRMLGEAGYISEEVMRSKLGEYVSTGVAQQVQAPFQCEVPELRHPVYLAQEQMRGNAPDKFFAPPLSNSMVDNLSLMNTLTSGTDEEVEGLPNLCCSCPPVKLKCDTAQETLLCVRATHQLMEEYGVSSLADVLRQVGMLGDRQCVYCRAKATGASRGIACVAGTYQCVNCVIRLGRLNVTEGFRAWVSAGHPVRHG